jgi:hypothetical protein
VQCLNTDAVFLTPEGGEEGENIAIKGKSLAFKSQPFHLD